VSARGEASEEIAQLQRERIIAAAVAVAAENGYAGMTLERLITRAGVARKTFYAHFSGAGDCFLAAYEHSLARIAAAALPAYRSETVWAARVRAGLAALLQFFQEEPQLARLVVVEVFAAGPEALALRAGLLRHLRALLDPDGAQELGPDSEASPLATEVLLGSASSVLYRHIASGASEPLSELLNPLMALLVTPYLGPAAAARELRRPAPPPAPRPSTAAKLARALMDGEGIRVGHRSLRVLELIAERPGMSNRELAVAAGNINEGQMSRLLAKLRDHGLIESVRPDGGGMPHAWRLRG
jgi:AcrR family transcriptional regulator